jgi:sulfate transport system permease protein
VEKLYQDYQGAAAFAVASLLALLALATLILKTWLELKQARDLASAQQATLSESGDTRFLSRSEVR